VGRTMKEITKYKELMSTEIAKSFSYYLNDESMKNRMFSVLKESDIVVIVATGFSLVAARFLRLILREIGIYNVFVTTPLEYIYYVSNNLFEKKENITVVIISYGSKNIDITNVVNDIARKKQHYNLSIFTANTKSNTSHAILNLGGIVIKVNNTILDRGFVSTYGLLSTIATMISVLNKYVNNKNITSFFSRKNIKNRLEIYDYTISNEILSELLLSDILISLGSYWTLIPAFDLQLKLVEGGLMPTLLFELKDFTHGKYMLSTRRRIGIIVFSDNRINDIINHIHNLISKNEIPILSLKTWHDKLLGVVDLMLGSTILLLKLSDLSNINVLRPKYIPLWGRNLYRYNIRRKK